MKCERCGGGGTRCAGAGQCDYDGSDCFDLVVNGINQNCGEYEPHPCPDCNGTGTKPEPEQYEIRKAFKNRGDNLKIYPLELGEVKDRLWKFFKSGFKAGYTSRNAEIEALKAEIELMRCCGNCGQEELPKEDKTCNSCKRGVEWSDDDNWTRKLNDNQRN